MTGVEITGVVRGTVRFPEHPDREGALGLVGGEDVAAHRTTFRSVGEAMTWCRKVLDGLLQPRELGPAGELLAPYTGPLWSEAEVTASNGHDRLCWLTEAGSSRAWYEYDGQHLGGLVREDPAP